MRMNSCALTPSYPARAPLLSEVSDPIVTIDTSKMTLVLEEESKKTTSASAVLPSAAETGFYHSSVSDSVLSHEVRQRIAPHHVELYSSNGMN